MVVKYVLWNLCAWRWSGFWAGRSRFCRTVTCSFSEYKIYPGHGGMYIRKDAQVVGEGKEWARSPSATSAARFAPSPSRRRSPLVFDGLLPGDATTRRPRWVPLAWGCNGLDCWEEQEEKQEVLQGAESHRWYEHRWYPEEERAEGRDYEEVEGGRSCVGGF